ncbi:MAG: tRNA (N(6)-L-threonylcarbamoyladenosine(37)-C(2))-methylthiotransferase MtaB [Nitrospirae bacterium]|nr:tRNA (N(6)-L-threonylcarbamoyladenosine(37)-C(2))-methylthiotransferase MtaB [Candidatus Manganitrophaceae bacterium]
MAVLIKSAQAAFKLIQIVPKENPALTVSFQALGCRLNQSESGALSGGFDAAGFRVLAPNVPADLCVINTCSVTNQAESKCRALIRRILKKNPQTFIALTGCYAQSGVDVLRQMPGVDLIAGTDHKMSLPQLVQGIIQGYSGSGAPLQKRDKPLVFHNPKISRSEFTVPNLSVFDHTTRPNVKIQDGCDFFCTFCIIPYTRGRSRSRNFEDVILEASIWAARGHREIVLTGVNLGEYESQGQNLVNLIQALEGIEGLQRIRISSIEPTTVSPALLHLMHSSKKLCSYLHLPLQSGSDAILSAMDRRYSRQAYMDFVQEAIISVPNLGLGTDVMVGFPGEDEADFDETVSLIRTLPFSYLHVFPYSRRKGTRVTRGNLVPVHPTVIKQRTKILCDLSNRLRSTFYRSSIGKTVSVLFENKNRDGLFTGLTENYIRVGVETNEDLSGFVKSVRIETENEGLALGRLLAS